MMINATKKNKAGQGSVAGGGVLLLLCCEPYSGWNTGGEGLVGRPGLHMTNVNKNRGQRLIPMISGR